METARAQGRGVLDKARLKVNFPSRKHKPASAPGWWCLQRQRLREDSFRSNRSNGSVEGFGVIFFEPSVPLAVSLWKTMLVEGGGHHASLTPGLGLRF